MPTRNFSKYFLYRWRYVIGYSLIGLLLAGLLIFAGLFLPGGLSSAETQSVITAASLNFADPSTYAIANLPFYLLQAGIFNLFGISLFTIKLPSLILALATAVGLVALLRRWFKPNIAVLTSLIAISTGQFLFIAQSGTPSILYIFWPVMFLLLGTQVTRAKKMRFLWKVLFAVAAALSLYTPLSIYPLITILLAIILHPHLRNIVRKLSRFRLSVVAVIFVVGIAPLIWMLTQNSQLALALLGVPDSWPPNLMENLVTVTKNYFLFWQAGTIEIMTPVFGLGSAILMILGLYRLIRTYDTTRSYLIILWIICLIPVLLLNPTYTSVTFLPSVMMLAAGITSLISYWYRLFPLNPYARVAGLVPIAILVGALVVSGLARYIYGYHYSPTIAPLFSKDITLLPKDTEQLVVKSNDDGSPSTESAFYESVAKYRDGLNVTTKPTADKIVVTRQAVKSVSGYNIDQIITNGLSNDADRFYVMVRK